MPCYCTPSRGRRTAFVPVVGCSLRHAPLSRLFKRQTTATLTLSLPYLQRIAMCTTVALMKLLVPVASIATLHLRCGAFTVQSELRRTNCTMPILAHLRTWRLAGFRTYTDASGERFRRVHCGCKLSQLHARFLKPPTGHSRATASILNNCRPVYVVMMHSYVSP